MTPAQDCLRPLFLPAPGARLRAAVFEADSPRRVCVLLNGQTEFIEKYFEVIDELRQRGFTVVALDWRGQGGSGRLVPGAPLRAHIHDFAEYDQDLDALMDQLVAPLLAGGALPIALAHSMGGHILLRYLHRHPGRIAAAIFGAPMVRFSSRGLPRWPMRLVTQWKVRHGHAEEAVWGMAKRDSLTLDFQHQLVTSDLARFQRTRDFLLRHPDLRLGAPTWGWVDAALRATDGMNEPAFAGAIATPSLVFGAGHDLICVTADTRRFASRMRQARYVEITGANHEILMERDIFRAQFWNAFDGFMADR